MEKNTSRNIINAFLYLLILVLLGIILYLLLMIYQGKLAQDAFNNANPPRLSGESTDRPATGDNGAGSQSEIINSQLEDISSWLTHRSELAAFSFKYPSIWTVEENTEGSFITLRNEKGVNMITVRVINKPGDMVNLDFANYASRAAGQEIQGYLTPAQFYQILTSDDRVGYQATWNVQFLGGEEFVSPPITYFAHPFDNGKSIQFMLENNNYKLIYDSIVESFRYI